MARHRPVPEADRPDPQRSSLAVAGIGGHFAALEEPEALAENSQR